MRLKLYQSAITSRSVFLRKICGPATFEFCNKIGPSATSLGEPGMSAFEGGAVVSRTSAEVRICRVGPGSFTPSPSQIPDVNLSIHPARVTARRLPPPAEPSGSSWDDPVGPSSTAMTCPLCSTGITPLHHYYRAVRPLRHIGTFGLAVG